MKHLDHLPNYNGDFPQLATELGDLRYDTLAEFLQLLANKIAADGDKDKARERVKLAAALHEASNHLAKSKIAIDEAWRISERFMID